MKRTALRVRAYPLVDAPDLLDHYGIHDGFYLEQNGFGVVTIGVAERIAIEPGADHVARAAEAAEEVLSTIEGDAPIVVGALPFGGSAGAELIVPQAAIVTAPDGARLIVAGRAGMPEAENLRRAVPPAPSAFRSVTPIPEPQTYLAAVAEAVNQIRIGALAKVVLARTLEIAADHPFDVPTLLERLRTVERGAFVFATPHLVGATPELLVRRSGDVVTSQPLAGTIARGTHDDATLSATLMASAKDRAEHALVVDGVREALGAFCDDIDIPAEPSVLSTSKVLHLATSIRGTLRAPQPSALTLAAALHPTPAVCGTPRDGALKAITALEPFDRGLYAGLVGWMDGEGNGCWAVSLRCASIEGDTARLYAGAGIVAGSDPDAELAETDAKFRSIIDALGYA